MKFRHANHCALSYLRTVVGSTLLSICIPTTSWATNDEPRIASTCEPETQARLQWLYERLDSRERYADLWWRGWTGFYGTGVIVQSVRAGFEDDRGKRADLIVSAVKALGGTTRLYFARPVARLGAEPMRSMPAADEESACRARVEQGELLLRQAAHEAGRRWSWKAHLANVAINLAGAVIVTEGYDENEGWTSAAVGIAVGEAMLWSHPWQAKRDLAEYEARFERDDAGLSWMLLPYGARGLRVEVRF